jgi:phosphoribosylcarboxyaminoimidazole (NCAIR) mutase
MLSLADPALRDRLKAYRQTMAAEVAAKDEALQARLASGSSR